MKTIKLERDWLESRYPKISKESTVLLEKLLANPNAPEWNYSCGDRLTDALTQKVTEFEKQLFDLSIEPSQAWIRPYVEWAYREVPFYRALGGVPADLRNLPSIRREDISAFPEKFVPDSLPLEDLIVYTTSGTTGPPVRVFCDPSMPNKYLPILRYVLAKRGVRLEGGPKRVSILQVHYQRSTYSLPTISTYLGGAANVKVNLDLSAWTSEKARQSFIEECQAEIIVGDPIAFEILQNLSFNLNPKALISGAMTLMPGLSQKLEEQFACPIIDLYSLTETGPLAWREGESFNILPHQIHIEILDPEGVPCPPGVLGQIAVTGGLNPYLPLVRYLTGDWGALDSDPLHPRLVQFSGRKPVIFYSAQRQKINTIDISQALAHLALSRFSLHQSSNLSLRLTLTSHQDPIKALEILNELFPSLRVQVDYFPKEAPVGKHQMYTSDLS